MPANSHPRDSRRGQRLEEGKTLSMAPFVEHIRLEVSVRREVYGRERNVAQQARASTLIQTKKTQLADNMHRSPSGGTLDLGYFSLHLQANLAIINKNLRISDGLKPKMRRNIHDLQGISEDLEDVGLSPSQET
jgi:hypothetical protein